MEPGENSQLLYEVMLDADIGPLEIYSYFKTQRSGIKILWLSRPQTAAGPP
jgi:hypothetical protein